MNVVYLIITMLILSVSSVSAAESVINVLDFGAKGDETFDNTAAFQAALDEAGKIGATVFVPIGKYRFNGTITIPDGAALSGTWQGPHFPNQAKGSALFIYAGRDNENSAPFVTMGDNSTIKGLTLFYPEQKAKDIHPYPWTIQGKGARYNIFDMTLANSYNAINCGAVSAAGHNLRNVNICALRRGVLIDKTCDIGRVENVHIHNVNWWTVDEPYKPTNEDIKAMFDYTMKNLEGFIIGRCDWEYMNNCFVIWSKIGFHFRETPDAPQTGLTKDRVHVRGNILITQSGSDMAPQALFVENVQDHSGIAFENCQFMNGIDIAPGNTGPVKFTNCGFWGSTFKGPLGGSVVVNKGSGEVMMTSCHFSTWEDPAVVYNPDPKVPLIRIENGSLLMTGCLFKDYGHTPDNHIFLGEGTDAAVINGNIVQGGKLRIANKTKSSVQIMGNIEKK